MRPRTAGILASSWRASRRLVIVLPWLWATVTAFALDPSRPLSAQAHRIWRSEDGMLQDTAVALLESREGFLWIGTGAGLARFNGTAFDHYSRMNVPEFTHNEIRCLAEGPDGAVWIGTSEPGLYLFRRGAVRTFGPAEGLPDLPIHRLLRDRAGTLWAAPVEGPLLRYDGHRFQTVSTDAAQLRIRALAEGLDGTIWVGTAGSGLWRLQQGRLVLAAVASDEITALDTGNDGEVWVGTRSGLLSLNEGRLESPAWTRDLPARAISALMLDRQGSLWMGVEHGGLFRRTRGGRLEAAPSATGSRWTPLSLLEDSSGALWSGTENRGLRVLYPVPFETVPSAGADSEEPAWMVCQDSQGTVWCLTGDQELGAIRQGRIQRVRPGARLAAPIVSIWPRKAGGLWAGTRNGELYVVDRDQFRRIPWPDGPHRDAILSLYEDPHQILWVATAHLGLIRFAPGAPPLLFPAVQGVQAMAGGGPDPLFLASRTRGLGILESGETRWLGRKEGLGSSGVRSLHLDADGFLWLGTDDGLRRYRDGAFKSLAGRPGPLMLAIHAVLEDSKHRMWLSTSQGVLQIPRASLVRGLDQGEPPRAVLFDHHDGMPSRETQAGAQPAAWITREGDLYFPTSRGLARIPGRSDLPPGPPLRLHILKAESDETVLPETSPLQVPPGTRRFQVHYAATSLTRADKVRFQYRLEGWEQAWNEVGGRRFSSYSNLPPGSYRFVLQAWRQDEDGPPQERSVEIHVQPFFYQRPLFWVICALGAGAFGGWLLRLRLQQLKARSAVLVERNRMAREIHDHLAQGFTGVLLQLEAAEARLSRMQGDPTPILTRLDHARNLAAASLQEARRSVMALRPRKPEGADLLGALRALADRLLAGTDIQVELAQRGEPRRLSNRLEEELLRMAQEALTNALRHGKARWVRVTLQFEGRLVRLSIDDDGQGFDPSTEAAGYGLRSMRESVKQLRGRLDLDSSQGLGSRVTITLPLSRWHL